MRRDVRSYRWDAQQAADAIQNFIAGLEVQTDAKTEVVHSAVERKFEIIGEVLNQCSKLDTVLAGRITDIRDIIAFRNVLSHGYAAVGYERVWRIAETFLPGLRAAVAALMREFGPA